MQICFANGYAILPSLDIRGSPLASNESSLQQEKVLPFSEWQPNILETEFSKKDSSLLVITGKLHSLNFFPTDLAHVCLLLDTESPEQEKVWNMSQEKCSREKSWPISFRQTFSISNKKQEPEAFVF